MHAELNLPGVKIGCVGDMECVNISQLAQAAVFPPNLTGSFSWSGEGVLPVAGHPDQAWIGASASVQFVPAGGLYSVSDSVTRTLHNCDSNGVPCMQGVDRGSTTWGNPGATIHLGARRYGLEKWSAGVIPVNSDDDDYNGKVDSSETDVANDDDLFDRIDLGVNNGCNEVTTGWIEVNAHARLRTEPIPEHASGMIIGQSKKVEGYGTSVVLEGTDPSAELNDVAVEESEALSGVTSSVHTLHYTVLRADVFGDMNHDGHIDKTDYASTQPSLTLGCGKHGLTKIWIHTQSGIPGGQATLKAPGMRLWDNGKGTGTPFLEEGAIKTVANPSPDLVLYAEGVTPGATTIDYMYTVGNEYFESILNVTVLKVDIDKVLSAQFSGADVNRLPPMGTYADKNKPMLMGCTVDGDACVMVKVSVDSSIASHTYVGVRKKGETAILDSNLIIYGGLSPLSWDCLGGDSVYEVVAGYDLNGNVGLDPDEVCAVYPDGVRVFTQDEYDACETYLYGVATGGSFASLSTAAELLFFFLLGGEDDTSVSVSDAYLYHPVGVQWAGATGPCSIYNFVNLDKVVAATEFRRRAVQDAAWFHRIEIETYFHDHPGTSHTFGPWSCTLPYFIFPDTGSLTGTDADMYFAFAQVHDFTVTSYSVKLQDSSGAWDVKAITAAGHFSDLYDFDITAGGFSIPAAKVQAGYPTLGSAGRVFKESQVNFNGSWTSP
jgi:hypothetical protein